MDAVECIRTRRSVREFEQKQVSDELIKEVLELAMCAPSAGNAQPWHFVVIKERDLLDEAMRLNPHAEMLQECPIAVLVCADLDLEQFKGLWPLDCSAATQNLLLAVRALGLGAVWTAVYPLEDRVEGFKVLLNMPDSVMPFALIPIGYPKISQEKEERFNPARVHYDRW